MAKGKPSLKGRRGPVNRSSVGFLYAEGPRLWAQIPALKWAPDELNGSAN